MTIASSTTKQQYNCNGSVKAFVFTFPVFESSDIKVILLEKTTGTETILTETTDYAVSAPNNDFSSGGTVATVQAYSADYSITLKREMEFTQETDYAEGDSFPADSHERALDKQTMISQQINEAVGRCLTFPETEGNTNTKLPDISLRKGKVFSFDSVTGEPVATLPLEESQTAQEYAAIAHQSVLDAETAKTGAETAQTGAQTAKGQAETARDAAQATAANCTNASNLTSGTLDNARLSADVTKQGNTFNGANQLLKLDANGKIPAIDGSQLTNLPSSSINENLIINGDFRVVQRGTNFPAAPMAWFTLDRWAYFVSGTMVHTVSQDTDVPTLAQTGITTQYSLKVDCTTVDSAIGADDLCWIGQKIEGYKIAPYVGQTLILSFWAKATKIGIYCAAFRSSTADRSYVAEYTINTTNTWEKKEIIILMDYSGGTWNYENGIGLMVDFILAAGSTFQTATANTWSTGNYTATTNQVNSCDSADNIFWITNVKLEPGSIATKYEPRFYEEELRLCQRYFIAYGGDNANMCLGIGSNTTATNVKLALNLPTTMRTVPTSLTYSSVSDWLINASAVSAIALSGESKKIVGINFTISGATAGYSGSVNSNNTINARIYINAEL